MPGILYFKNESDFLRFRNCYPSLAKRYEVQYDESLEEGFFCFKTEISPRMFAPIVIDSKVFETVSKI